MEYIRYCNICKKVWCYTDDDIRLNSANRTWSNLTRIMSGVSFIAGSKYNGYELGKISNNSVDKIIDYDKCPHCNSRNFKEISKEEYDDIIKKEEIYNNTIINPSATTEELITRIEMFIEDNEWKQAEIYCNYSLDKNIENGYIWLLKLIINNKWKIKDNRIDFNNNYIKIEENQLYDKVIKYSNNKETLKIIEQCKEDLNECYYRVAIKKIDYAETTDDYRDAIIMFEYIKNYKDSNKYIEIYKNKIEEIEEQNLKLLEYDLEEKNEQINEKIFLFCLLISVLYIILIIVIINNYL